MKMSLLVLNNIQEGQEASSELNWAASSFTSSLPEASNGFQDVITLTSDPEDVSTHYTYPRLSYLQLISYVL